MTDVWRIFVIYGVLPLTLHQNSNTQTHATSIDLLLLFAAEGHVYNIGQQNDNDCVLWSMLNEPTEE